VSKPIYCEVCGDLKGKRACSYGSAADYMGEPLHNMSTVRLDSLYAGAWDANNPDRKVLLHERRRRQQRDALRAKSDFGFGYAKDPHTLPR